MTVSDVRRQKALEDQNTKLKMLLGEAMLDNGNSWCGEYRFQKRSSGSTGVGRAAGLELVLAVDMRYPVECSDCRIGPLLKNIRRTRPRARTSPVCSAFPWYGRATCRPA